MRWVTRRDVRVDRMACGWLIRRFIDPDAEFIFLPEGTAEVPDGAHGFDIPGSEFSHRRGHASFHAILTKYAIEDPVLSKIARIVDEADVVQDEALEPASPGLDMVCRGISMISQDDKESFRQGGLIYDALYAVLQGEESA